MSQPAASWRQLLPGQKAKLHVYDIGGATDTVIYETDQAIIEAPNWTLDGAWLIYNREGQLYRIAPSGGTPELIDSGTIQDFNNDHVLAPDGLNIYGTSEDGHIYRIPLAGGQAERVTNPTDGLMAHYLHGVSPDGDTLAHIGGKARANTAVYNVYTYNWRTDQTVLVTDSPKPHDGSEYSPDGQWIYFNSERNSTIPGHSQIFRMRTDGSGIEQLTDDERVNWFPHISPDGAGMVYISFPAGTLGHPANLDVELVVTDPLASAEKVRFGFFGGQGTINVNSWAPDSTRFAYVEYPLD